MRAIAPIPNIANTEAVAPPRDLLIRQIRAHVKQGDAAKERADRNHQRAEEHYIAAGRYLAEYKNHYFKSWKLWEITLKIDLKISTGRANELMQIASGKKSVQEVRDATAQRVRDFRSRQGSSLQAQCNEEDQATVEADIKTDIAVDPLARTFAREFIGYLLMQDVREEAIKLVIEGEHQGDFDSFRNAVADLYQKLSKAGR
jgi:hypothetical protein